MAEVYRASLGISVIALAIVAVLEVGMLVYSTIDLNGLKEINDSFGHVTGDKMIVGAAECIAQAFGARGKMYRIGGDEFVVLPHADADGQAALFEDYEARMRAWSEESGVPLSASYGCAAHAEFPDKRITELARTADDRMYAAKAAYYRTSGRERRRFRAEAPV